MFSSEAEVIYPDATKERIPTAGAIEYLYQACKDENLNVLHLLGHKKYLEGLVEQNPPLNYGCEKIEVKVN